MAYAHDDVIGSPGGNGEFLWEAFWIYDERVVAHSREGVFQRLIDRSGVVEDIGYLTVHDARSTDDLSAKRCPNALMAQADT